MVVKYKWSEDRWSHAQDLLYLLLTSKAKAFGHEFGSNDIITLLLPPSIVALSIFGSLPQSVQYITLKRD